jgi:hypothetical protein
MKIALFLKTVMAAKNPFSAALTLVYKKSNLYLQPAATSVNLVVG